MNAGADAYWWDAYALATGCCLSEGLPQLTMHRADNRVSLKKVKHLVIEVSLLMANVIEVVSSVYC